MKTGRLYLVFSIVLATILASGFALAGPSCAREPCQQVDDAITAAALDYVDGFYEGDTIRMARAVHPDLVKRDITTPSGSADQVVRTMTAQDLIRVTGSGMGKGIAERDGRRSDVKVLDVFGDLASVRVDAITWVDYLQMAKVNGEWKIINVLWGWREAEG